MHLFPHLRDLTTLHHLKSSHAIATITGLSSIHPSQTLTSLLLSLTLLPPNTKNNNNSNSLLPYAISLFHSLPSPTTFSHNLLIRLHLPSHPLPSLHLFLRLLRLSLSPDLHSYPLAISASSRLLNLPLGRSLHSHSLRLAFSSSPFTFNSLISLYSSCSSLPDAQQLFTQHHHIHSPLDLVSYNALLSGYANAGQFSNARNLFDLMPQRDRFSWGTLISAYSRAGLSADALHLFDQMISFGLHPDNASIVSALSSCARLGLLDRGTAIHRRVHRPIDNPRLLTALVDMYAKCGAMDAALNLFDSCSCKNQFTWNAIIVGLAMHGRGELSLDYFHRMRDAGVRPDGVTFLGVFVACSHAGFVDAARKLFDEMEAVYAVPRELKHYGCMSDLLGRAGLIGEAMEMIEGMPMKGDAYVWGGVLAGCRHHHYGNVGVAEIAARRLLELNQGDVGVYSIVAGIYADERRWEDVARIRSSMDAMKVKRNVAMSLVQ